MAVTVLAALVATGLTGAGYRGHPHYSPAPVSLTQGIAVAPCSAGQIVAVPPGSRTLVVLSVLDCTRGPQLNGRVSR